MNLLIIRHILWTAVMLPFLALAMRAFSTGAWIQFMFLLAPVLLTAHRAVFWLDLYFARRHPPAFAAEYRRRTRRRNRR